MASSSGPDPEEEIDHEEAEARLGGMRQAVQEQMRQINILEMDASEHRLVLEALDPLDTGRKCFRMVGSVIVERTVSDIKPALQNNLVQVGCPTHCQSSGTPLVAVDAPTPRRHAVPRVGREMQDAVKKKTASRAPAYR